MEPWKRGKERKNILFFFLYFSPTSPYEGGEIKSHPNPEREKPNAPPAHPRPNPGRVQRPGPPGPGTGPPSPDPRRVARRPGGHPGPPRRAPPVDRPVQRPEPGRRREPLLRMRVRVPHASRHGPPHPRCPPDRGRHPRPGHALRRQERL